MTSITANNLRTQYKLLKPLDSPLNAAFDAWVRDHKPNRVTVGNINAQGKEAIWVRLHDLTGDREFEASFEVEFLDLIEEVDEEVIVDPDALLMMELDMAKGITRWP